MPVSKRETKSYWILGFILLWFQLEPFVFLTRYPLVHSDESWLGGLTRNMMAQGSMSVTEPFFDSETALSACDQN